MRKLTLFLLAALTGSVSEAKQMQTHTYKAVSGHPIQLDIHWADSELLRPTIFFMHGGALIMGNRGFVNPASTYFLDQGYNFVSIDYRLAPQAKLPEIIQDINDAWDWVQKHGGSYGINTKRMVVMGQSAGGYLALSAGYQFSPRPRAVVSLYGYGDLTGAWYAEPSEHYRSVLDLVSESDAWQAVGDMVVSNDSGERFPFYLYSRQQGTWPFLVAGRQPSETKWFSNYEPLRNIGEDFPPTILLHGEADTDVPVEQSILLASAFADHGVPYEFVSKPNWGHGFDSQLGLDDEDVAMAYKAIADFLEEHLRQ